MSSTQQSVPTAEQVLTGLFGGSDSRAFVVDRRMHVVQGGVAALRLPGEAQQPEGRSRPETCHRQRAGSDAPCAGCPAEQVLRTGRGRTGEVYVASENRWYEIHASPIAAADGVATHALIIPHDITKRKRVEDVARESERAQRRLNERLRVLHEVSNELTEATSVEELCRWVVELGRDRLGFDRLSVWLVADDGEHIKGMFGTDEQGRLRDERGRRLAADEKTKKFLSKARLDGFIKAADVDLHDDGVRVVGSGTSVWAPMWDGEKTVGFLGADNLLRGEPFSQQDCEVLVLYASAVGHLCLRKQVEQKLRDSDEKLELILHYTNDGISMTEYDPPTHGRRLLFCNDRYVEMSGRSREELMAADDLNVFVKVSESHEQLQRQREARSRGEPTDGVASWLRPDGAENYFEWKAVPIRISDTICHIGIDRDITERRRAEEAVRESEHRYRTLFEQAADSIVLIDPQTEGFADFNELAYRQMGYTREEFARLTVADLEAAETPEQVRRHMETVLCDGQDVFETTHRTKDGEIRDVLVTARLLTIRGQRLIHSIWRDVTEYKRVERELRSAERRYRHIVETVPVMLWSQDMVSNRILFVSSSCKAFLGYSPQEIYDDMSLWLGSLHPEDQDRLYATVEAFRRRPGVWSGEYRMVHRNGKVLRILQSVTGEVDEDGTLVRVHGVSVDITDRWYMERTTRLRLRISQASVSAGSEGELIDRCMQAVREELAASGVIFYDYDAPSNRLVIRSHCGDFDSEAAELIGSPEVKADATRVCARAAFERRMVFVPDMREEPLVAYGRVKIDQLQMCGLAVIPLVADGRLLGVLEAVSGQRWDLGEPDVRMLESIGHELAVGLAGRRAQAALAEAQRLRTMGALAAGIAHDFNNMLVSIVGGASYVKARVSDDKKLFEVVERLEQGASRAAELVQRLLAFGQHRTEPDALLGLNDAVRNALRLIEPGVPKGVRLATHLAEPLAAIRADGHQIEQMVIDLCLNACEAMPNGGRLTITTGAVDVDEGLSERCELHSGQVGRHVVLTVTDSGVGMGRPDLRRAFEPFHTTKPGGHGLGLPAVHGIVSAHRGAIEIITAPGEGTTFRVYLPVADPAEAQRLS